MADETQRALALAFVTWTFAHGEREQDIRARLREYAARRKQGETHEQILELGDGEEDA